MLSLTGYRLVLVHLPVNMRMGFDGLSGFVCNELKEDPFKPGTLYAFFSKLRNQVRILTWEEDGLSLYCKRLSRGTYGEPRVDPATKSTVLTKKELMLILEGVEIKYRRRYNGNK